MNDRPIVGPFPRSLAPYWSDVAEPYPSPYGAGGEQQISGSAQVEPGTTRQLASWAGPGGRPYPMRVSVAPDVRPQTAGNNPVPLNPSLMADGNLFARIAWEIGVARFVADLDLNGGTLALPLMAERASVSIVNGGPDLVGFVATFQPGGGVGAAGVTEARRTVVVSQVPSGVTIASPIPAFARAVYVAPALAADWTLGTLDGKAGATTLGLYNSGGTTAKTLVQLPNGCAQLTLLQASGGAIDVTLIYMLGLP